MGGCSGPGITAQRVRQPDYGSCLCPCNTMLKLIFDRVSAPKWNFCAISERSKAGFTLFPSGWGEQVNSADFQWAHRSARLPVDFIYIIQKFGGTS